MYALCNGMDGTGEHYAKWNKPGGITIRYGTIRYDLAFNWNHFFLNSVSDILLASMSLISFSGYSSIHVGWRLFICLPNLVGSYCLFLWFLISVLPAVFVGWTSVVGVLWASVVRLLWYPCFNSLGLPFLPFVWALLLYLCFACWWLLLWCVVPSSWLTGSHNSCLVLNAVVQVLFNKVILPDNQTYASKKNPLPHQQY